MDLGSSIAFSCAAALLLVASVHDVLFRTIPNAVPISIAFVGVFLRVRDHQLMGGAVAGVALFAVSALLWQRGWMGGGDVKLLASAAMLVPPMQATRMVILVALTGGLLALVYLTMSCLVPRPAGARPATRFKRILRVEQRRIWRRASIPYGVAIAAGTFMVLLRGSS